MTVVALTFSAIVAITLLGGCAPTYGTSVEPSAAGVTKKGTYIGNGNSGVGTSGNSGNSNVDGYSHGNNNTNNTYGNGSGNSNSRGDEAGIHLPDIDENIHKKKP